MQAKGEYIAFVDSDDYVEPEFLEKLYNNIKKVDADIAICGFQKVTESSYLRSYIPEEGIFSANDFFKQITQTEFVVWNKLYRRTLLEENHIRFLLPYIGEDWLFCLQAMLAAQSYVSVKDELYYYYQHEQSLCHMRITVNELNNICDFFTGIVVFFSIILVNTPPRVSIPSERGVTSNSSTSFTSPISTPP